MTKLFKTLCFAGVILSAGCLTVKPLGPMKNVFPEKPDESAVSLEPIIKQAPRPTAPAMLVTPGEVTESNANAVIEKLKQELEQDQRTLESMPQTSEVSYVGRR